MRSQPTTSSGTCTYSGFNGQCINGFLRPRREGEKLKDTDPYFCTGANRSIADCIYIWRMGAQCL